MLLLRSKEESSFLQKIEGFMLTLVCIGLASKAQAEKQASKQTNTQTDNYDLGSLKAVQWIVYLELFIPLLVGYSKHSQY